MNQARQRAVSPTQYRLITSQYGIFARFMESFLNLVGSSIRSRHKKTAPAGIIPSPSDKRQTARRWFSPNLTNISVTGILGKTKAFTTYIQKSTNGTKAAMTKPKSIIESGDRINVNSDQVDRRIGDTYSSQEQTTDAGRSLQHLPPQSAPTLPRNHMDTPHRCRFRARSYGKYFSRVRRECSTSQTA